MSIPDDELAPCPDCGSVGFFNDGGGMTVDCERCRGKGSVLASTLTEFDGRTRNELVAEVTREALFAAVDALDGEGGEGAR